MEDDEEIPSQLSPGTGSPASPPSQGLESPESNGRITVTVASAPPPPSNALTLALPIQQQQQHRSGGGGGGGGGGGREDCWSEGATAVLIDAWGERYLELSRGNLKQKHWKEVADVVSSRDDYGKAPKTDVQCKNRIDTVKKKYKQEKAKAVSAGSSAPPSRWPFYKRLDQLIGPRTKIPGVGGAGNAPVTSSHPQKVPIGIPVGLRSAPVLQRHQQSQPRKLNPQFRSRRRPVTDSESSESDPDAASPDSMDSFPPVSVARKRARIPREVSSNSGRPGSTQIGWGNSVSELTRAILKFGEAYEHAETSKLQQVVEMEKQRMKFTKELELQRMEFFMKTQMELSQLKHGRRGGGSNHHLRPHQHHHSNANNNHSDGSN